MISVDINNKQITTSTHVQFHQLQKIQYFFIPIILLIKNNKPMSKILIILLFFFTAILLTKFHLNHETTKINLNSGHNFEIFRDDKGIPHIFSHQIEDTLFGLGYAEAEDRLWALMIKKFLVEGRMAELFGREALPSDYFARNFKFYDVGIMNAKLLDEDTRRKAQAYCDGINYYAKNSKFLPLEFYVFWVDWQDWTIENSLGMLAFSAFSLEFDWMYEIARQRLLQTVGFDLAYQIINYGSKTLFRQVTIMKEDEIKEQGLWKEYDATKQIELLREKWGKKITTLGSIHLPTFQFEGSGSNAWVIGGNHTHNGKPLLANDPHLGSLTPPAFYVCELGILDDQNNLLIQTFGATMSGVPSISIGINKNQAWGSTAAYIDNKDMFYETVRIQDSTFQYLFEGEWRNFTERQQVYKIRWEGEEARPMYENHRGPVIENIFDELYYKYSYPMPLKYRINHTITCDSALYRPDSTSLKNLLDITFSLDYKRFENIGHLIKVPNIDSVYITKDGDYGYSAVGRNPIRDVYELSGFMKDGKVADYEMKGFLDANPRVKNPKKGYVAMCNNKFAPNEYAHRGSLHQITTGRAYRLESIITEKINSKQKFTFEDMKTMQLDYKDEFLSETFPFILERLESLRHIWSNPKTQNYFRILKKWDYFMPKNSTESSLYHIWERLLQSSLLIQTELNEQEREAIINHAFFQNYMFRLFEKIRFRQLGEEEVQVCQNQETNNHTKIHPCEAVIALAFKRIPQEAERIFGTEDVSQYHWGKIHLATYKSIPLSDIPGLGTIWQRQTPYGGNSRTLNVGIMTHQSKGDNKYRSVAGPVFRFVTDLNRTEWSLDIGNSANIFSEYYDNFLGTDEYIVYTRENPKIRLPENWKLHAKGVTI